MIKILDQLKKNNATLHAEIQKKLDLFGQHSSKGFFNRYSFTEYLDFISFAESYSMIPDQYHMVMNVLDDLNPRENENMRLIKSSSPKQYKSLIKTIETQSGRTRERVKSLLKKDAPKPKKFGDALAKFKSVFA